jgi:surfeit locus 1 family protein
MLAVTGLFLALGIWQWMRLKEKEAIAAEVGERLENEPVPYLAATEEESLSYRPIRVSGRYLPAQTVLVFTSLADPKGEIGGPGYWVMTPLALEGGGTIWVNRGFVPDSARAGFAAGGDLKANAVMLSGIAMPSERANSFTPAADAAGRIEWVRDIDRLSALAPHLVPPVASVYLDLPAGPRGELPQGGETIVSFPNNHLGYAMTWFGLAVLTPILLVIWLRGQRAAPS